MTPPRRRSVTALAATLAAALYAPAALAQVALPPPPPPPSAPSTLSDPTAVAPVVDAELRLAVYLLRTRQTADAVAVLGRAAQQRGVDLRGYSALAVLFRLAYGRANPGVATAGEPPAVAPAPPVAEGELPPPPSDELSHARILDAVVERLARWDEDGARMYFDRAADDAALAGPDGAAFLALRSLTRVGRPPPSTLDQFAGPAPSLLPDRPAGTVAGFEVFTMYVSVPTYGFMLGTWAGLAVTDDSRNALRIALPLTGLAAGVVGAVLLDRTRTVRRGRGYAVETGLALGSMAGGAAALYAGTENKATWGLLLGGATVGIGASLGLAHLVDALPGTMTYATSAGAWGGAVGLALALAVVGDHASNESVASGLLIGEGVGLVLAMLSSDALKPTPGQTRWADVGACGGALVGGLLGAASRSDQGVGIGLAAGILGGGVLGWLLAAPSAEASADYLRQSGARATPLRFGVAPLPGGGALLNVGM